MAHAARGRFRARLLPVLLLALVAPVVASGPARAGTVTVPSSIDATGGADVVKALNDFFAHVPDGSTIQFPKNGKYRIEDTLLLEDRHNLVIQGNGSQFFPTTDGYRERAQWKFRGGSGITVQDVVVKGNNKAGGTSDAAGNLTLEAQHGFTLQGVDHFTLLRANISETYGDFVTIADNNGPWSKHVTIRDSHFERNGRQGISITSGEDVVIERNNISQVRRGVIDIEPDSERGGALRVRIADNDFGESHLPFFQSGGRPGRVEDISLVGNRFHGEIMRVIVKPPGTSRRARFSIIDNIRVDEDKPLNSTPLSFFRTDGIIIRGNRQAFSADSKRQTAGVKLTASCGVQIEDNDWAGVTQLADIRTECPTGPTLAAGTPRGSGTTIAAAAPGATTDAPTSTGPSWWVLGVLGAVLGVSLIAVQASRNRHRRARRRSRTRRLPAPTFPDDDAG
jgi:hypothetical protein